MPKLLGAIAGLTLGTVAIDAAPAQAAILTYDFTVGIDTPEETLEFDGYFSYDTDIEFEEGVFSFTDFSFNFITADEQPRIYTLDDLVPESAIFGAVPVGTPPQPVNGGDNGFAFGFLVDDEEGELPFSVFVFGFVAPPSVNNLFLQFIDGDGEVSDPEEIGTFTRVALRETPTDVPEPTVIGGLLLVGAGLAASKRLKAAQR
ncbi:PEP-CTERM sorting domain-containing protein [Oscillatoria sp. FACHB-1407]|uniref:PEP-CTERM sorting domain-containing protein n=1 Tax=Oscillatoria sp. FACHB-1407 TaxID=2692847 RepID=UPI001682700C|nr:PEP-CTERM sorting domain-containing protein [Oscillatoria sp. FACHB-1407]